MHYTGRFDVSMLGPDPTFASHSRDYTNAPLVDHTSGSVHTGLSIGQLGPSGTLLPHVHSYEESFYLLDGHARVRINDETYLLGPGDYGVVKVVTTHAWQAAGGGPVRWLQMAAPQPKPRGMERDTFFVKNGQPPTGGAPLDVNDPKGNLLSHFDASQIPSGEDGRIATGGLKGVFLKWLLDEKFGARHHRLLFIEYQPGVGIGLHDHKYEEAYFIMSGEVEADRKSVV